MAAERERPLRSRPPHNCRATPDTLPTPLVWQHLCMMPGTDVMQNAMSHRKPRRCKRCVCQLRFCSDCCHRSTAPNEHFGTRAAFIMGTRKQSGYIGLQQSVNQKPNTGSVTLIKCKTDRRFWKLSGRVPSRPEPALSVNWSTDTSGDPATDPAPSPSATAVDIYRWLSSLFVIKFNIVWTKKHQQTKR